MNTILIGASILLCFIISAYVLLNTIAALAGRCDRSEYQENRRGTREPNRQPNLRLDRGDGEVRQWR